jgi:hypothetical protein
LAHAVAVTLLIVMYIILDVCDVTLSIYISTPGKLEKYACMATVGIEPTTFGILAHMEYITCRHRKKLYSYGIVYFNMAKLIINKINKNKIMMTKISCKL